MDHAENEKYKDLSQTFSAKKEDVAINDSRQLMRRNTSEAWTELEFTGSNEMPYTARWYVARAHRKISGAVQDVRWTLENKKSGIQLNKKNEIKVEIQAAVGLTFEQFCRTTMLAQGDFTKFLQSKESEKSDILEKLTGTSIYSEIGAEIYAATKERRTEYENQNRKLEGIHILAEEEVTAIKEAIATQNAGVKEANEQKTTAKPKEAKENEKALNAKVEACQKQYVLLQTAFDSKKTSYDDIRTLYDKQKEAVEEWAKETRSRLVVGDTCPVCGQEIKSLCKDEDFQSVLAPIRTSLETKEKEYKETEQALNNNRTESNTYGTLAENARQSTARALRSYNLAHTDAQAKCAQCNGVGLSTTTGGFQFSLFFLRQTVVARSLRQAVNKGEGGVLPFRVPSFPEDVGSDAVHGGTYVLLFVGGERLVIDDVVFQLIQHSVGRVEGLACSVHMFLAGNDGLALLEHGQ
jgi:DNA repair exonuclease SbcCD ATPase subunit